MSHVGAARYRARPPPNTGPAAPGLRNSLAGPQGTSESTLGAAPLDQQLLNGVLRGGKRERGNGWG